MTTRATQPSAIDGQTFAIGVLGVTAAIFFVGYLLLVLTPKPAFAIGQSDRAGDYVMLTQQINNSTEVLVVVDAAVKQANLYGFQSGSNTIELLQRLPLDRLPGSKEREERGRRKP